MWKVNKGSMVSAAGSILGFESRKQPDWFKVSSVVLSELIEKRNALFGKWLSSGANCDRQMYVQRRLVASAVKRANDWLLKKARSVEAGMLSNGSTGCAWRSLKNIQRERVGLMPVLSKPIKKLMVICVQILKSLFFVGDSISIMFSTSGVLFQIMWLMQCVVILMMRATVRIRDSNGTW